jgi:predicted dehydrogenase
VLSEEIVTHSNAKNTRRVGATGESPVKEMKIIHIGLGTSGRRWLEIVRDHRGGTSVACVDPQAAELDRARSHFPGLRSACYDDLAKALESTKADAAIVSSPPALHATHAVQALEAGLAVIIEPPLAVSVADGARVVEVSRRTGRPILVAQNHRHGRYEQTLKKLLGEGKVGGITHVSYVDRRARPVQDNFLFDVEYAQLMDTGAHHFDSLRSVLSVNPKRIMARCDKAPWSPYRHGSTTEASLEMEGNIHVQYYGSLTSNRDESSLWIEGDKGILRADEKRVWWRKRGWKFFLPLQMGRILRGDARKYPRDGMAALLDQLMAALTLKRMAETHGEDNLWTLSMIEAAMTSDKTGKVVNVADILKAAGVAHGSSQHPGGAVTG